MSITPRQAQKEQTRRDLIATATRLFVRQGIGLTPTAEIAKVSKLSHGAVFVHFPTREDLVLAVIDEFGASLSARFKDALAKQEHLPGILGAHLDTLSEYEDFYFRLLTEMQTLPEAVRSTVFMLNAAVSCKLYDAYLPLRKAHEVKDIERGALFNTWMALVHYHVVNREVLSDRKPILQEKRGELIKHFLLLIRN